MRPARERLLDAAMLVAQSNFQMQHFFAVALESKMSRLDDAGVNRPDGDLVNLAPLHAEEFAVSRGNAVGARSAHRLEPGMAGGLQTVLLENFALEQVRLRLRE